MGQIGTAADPFKTHPILTTAPWYWSCNISRLKIEFYVFIISQQHGGLVCMAIAGP